MNTRAEYYLGAVREHLTLRGLPPRRIGEHLEEIAGHLEDSGTDPINEYGSPDQLAEELVSAEGHRYNAWRRIAVWGPLALASMLSLILLTNGREPALITAADIESVFVGAGLALVPLALTTARLRDALWGVNDTAGMRWMRPAISTVALVVAVIALSLLPSWALGDRALGVESVRSWVPGLVLLAVVAPIWWIVSTKTMGAPLFSPSSTMRASRWDRRVEFNGHSDTKRSIWNDDRPAVLMLTAATVAVAGSIGLIESVGVGALAAFTLGSFAAVVLRRRAVLRS